MKKLVFTYILLNIFIVLPYSYLYSAYISNCTVEKIIDGDTIDIKCSNKVSRIRLIGIQAPETHTNPVQIYGKESTAYINNLLNKKTVSLEFDDEFKKDKYNRILGNIYVDDIWVNLSSIDKGFSFVYILNNNPISNLAQLIEAENIAIKNNVGLWKYEPYKVIFPPNAINHIGEYKVIDAYIYNIVSTKHSIWLHATSKGNKGLSVRIDKKQKTQGLDNFDDLEKYRNQSVRIRGFINLYNPNFGPLVSIYNIQQLQIIE